MLSLQNGSTADVIAGRGRTRAGCSSGFVNFGADYLEPGVVMQGNVAAFRLGEPTAGHATGCTARGRPPVARPTDNIAGLPVGKEAYGAMLFATAVSDLSIADAPRIPASGR